MPFFKKADEMEMEINFKAMRLAWIVENLILVVWVVADALNGRGLSIASLVISVQNLLFFGTKLYLGHKMSRGGDEE